MSLKSKFLIYGLKDPHSGEIRYVGRSCSGLKRPREHSCPRSLENKKTYCTAWIKSLQGVKPLIEILEFAESSLELDLLEIAWIAKAKNLGWRLTNHTAGGSGTRTFKHSLEALEKISQASKKLWASNPPKLTEDSKRRCGNAMRNKTHSLETKRSLAQAKGSHPFRVTRICDGVDLGEFVSISDCSKSLKLCRKEIARSLKQIQLSKRFIFQEVR